MFANVYMKTLRDLRRGIVGWCLGIVALVGMMVALWPTVRDMDFAGIVEEYPEAMQEMFALDQIATGPGFLNAELFSWLLPVMFITYGVGLGARLLAREEESGTLDVLLSTPLSRTRLMMEKAAAAATGLVILAFVLFLSTWLLAGLADMGITVGYAAGASLAMLLLGLLFGGVAYAFTAVTGRRGLAIAVSVSLAVAGYVLYAASSIVDSIASWDWVTPFQHAIGVGPASTGEAGLPRGYLWLVIAAVVVVAAVRPVFHRRDLGI